MLRKIGLIILIAFSVSACGETLEQQWASSNELYIGTVDSVNDLYVTGEIDDAKFVELSEYKDQAKSALEAMDAAVADNNEASFNIYLDIFMGWLDKMLIVPATT